MVLPLSFLIISIYVYEDETPWDGWILIQDKVHLHDDFHTKEACLKEIGRFENQYACSFKCHLPKKISKIAFDEDACEKAMLLEVDQN